MGTRASDLAMEAPDSAGVPDAVELLKALQAVRNGDFRARLPSDWTGISGKIADTFNEIVTANDHLAGELRRVSETVGRQGKTGQRLRAERRLGSWGSMEESVNGLIDDLVWPISAVTNSIDAVARGDLSQTVPYAFQGRRTRGNSCARR